MENKTCTLLVLALLANALSGLPSQAQSTYEAYTFTTLAGNAGYGSVDGTGSAVRFWDPIGVAVDSEGNAYVADSGNNTIRKVTPVGLVTTIAGLAGSIGTADGAGSVARFNDPVGVAADSVGNVYVAEAGNHTIRKVTPAGVVTTLAGLAGSQGSTDGTGSAARFNNPSGMAADSAGNVYVADTWNHTIRKVTAAGGVTTLVGLTGNEGSSDGTGSAAHFFLPRGVAVDSAGNLYVADSGNQTIRKVTLAGVVTTLAGLAGNPGSADGTGSVARFSGPSGLAVDSAGNVYASDLGRFGGGAIRKVTPAGVVTTLAGLAGGSVGSEDGAGSTARFNGPSGVAVDNAGNVYVADTSNHTIRKVTPAGVVTTLAGTVGYGSTDGTRSAARFNNPLGVAVDTAGNVYVADTYNSTIRKVTSTGVVTTLAGLADPGGYGANGDGTGSAARFSRPSAVAVDSAGNVYVADSGNRAIRKVTPAGVVTTLPGGGDGRAEFEGPEGLAVDSGGNVYVADHLNFTLRKVTAAGVVTTVAGLAGNRGRVDGTGSAARFYQPYGVAVDIVGNLYVADYDAIRKVTPAGVVTTLAGPAELNADGGPVGGYADGTGSEARFGGPPGLAGFSGNGRSGVAVDNAGNVYVADQWNRTIRKVTPAGVVTTLAGLADCDLFGYCPGGSTDGTGSAARLNRPQGVAVDNAGNVYVADSGNNTIRKGYAALSIRNSGPGFGFNDGQFGFDLTGPAGRLVVVEASIDLMSWLPLWTNTFTGALNFRDSQSGVSSNRFYRARTP